MSFNPIFKTKAIDASRLQAHLMGHRLTQFYDTEQGYRGPAGRCLLAHCRNCGKRLEIHGKEQCLYGEALAESCDNEGLRLVESQAWLISEVPSLLFTRFREEIVTFGAKERAYFEEGDFQPENGTLVSRDGIWQLRYELRYQPSEPIDSDNRQSARGIVFIDRQVRSSAMRWMRYTGSRFNPNGHEDVERWLVIPLEHGEVGWVYEDVEGRRRFRRENGTVGYYISHFDYVLEVETSPSLPPTPPLDLPSKSATDLMQPPGSKFEKEFLWQGDHFGPRM